MTIKQLAIFERSYCQCRQCCDFCKSGKPGALAPGDIDSIAEFLGIEEWDEEFLQYFFDARDDGPGAATPEFPDGATPALRPSVDEEGRCIFEENGLCQIHPVAPFECSRTKACDPADGAAAMKALGKAITQSADYVQTWWWLRKQHK